MLKVKIDKDGFIQYIRSDCLEGEADYIVDDNTFDKIDFDNIPFTCYRFENGIVMLDDEKYQKYLDETKINEIRKQRKEECFPIINRGQRWQKKLTESQSKELDDWYNDWLKAPQTLLIPEKPTWIK